MSTIFDQKQIFSDCCHAYIIYGEHSTYCANCHQILHNYQDEDEILIDVQYNVSDEKSEVKKIASDLIRNQLKFAPRLAHDLTLELVYKECPQCKCNFVRLAEDDNRKKFFICTKCRHVFRT
jgi:DNA-directed RNA polymerase subunit M/transcription elongation factor TFIIS